jgi:hypothetical protein
MVRVDAAFFVPKEKTTKSFTGGAGNGEVNKYSFEQNQQTETFLSWYQSSLSFETKKGAKILLFHKVGL